MKKILLFLMIIAMFAACSTPKYTYYFDHYPSKKTTVLKSGDTEKKQENFAANAETTYVASNVDAPVPFELSTAVASTSKEIFIQAKPTTTSGVHEVAIKRNSTNKKGLFKTIRDSTTTHAPPTPATPPRVPSPMLPGQSPTTTSAPPMHAIPPRVPSPTLTFQSRTTTRAPPTRAIPRLVPRTPR